MSYCKDDLERKTNTGEHYHLTYKAVAAINKELQEAGHVYFSGHRSWEDYLNLQATCKKTIADNQTGLDKGEVFSKIVQDVLSIVTGLEHEYEKVDKPAAANRFSFFDVKTEENIHAIDQVTLPNQG